MTATGNQRLTAMPAAEPLEVQLKAAYMAAVRPTLLQLLACQLSAEHLTAAACVRVHCPSTPLTALPTLQPVAAIQAAVA